MSFRPTLDAPIFRRSLRIGLLAASLGLFPGAVLPALAEEAVRIVRRMPNWNPGKIGGRPIRVQQTLPIKFELKD